jgi:mono/diheme cytochrome c family protein
LKAIQGQESMVLKIQYLTFFSCCWPVAALAASVDFVADVRPIFQKHCYECHGEQKQKSGLRLDIKAAAFHGGDGYGPAVVAGNTEDSPLLQLVSSNEDGERMPPQGPPLSPREIDTLKRWIAEGAVWPEGVDLAKLEDRSDHWSFKPLTQPVPSPTLDSSWPENPIDRFVLARLEQLGWKPAPAADPVAWLRRVSFDLTGLPPTPADITRFSRAAAGDLWSAMHEAVDALLDSPRYGERWGQHWLDVVRYADTHGFEVNTERPNAWPYRDYVIRAFNQDIPYDRFIQEQIVGDTLGPESDAATGFLITASVLLPGQIGKDEPSKRLARQDSLDEIVMNVGQTFLGLSIGCARCHDHKFDPISQRDYYAMQALVAGVEYADRELRTAEAEQARRNREAWQARVAAIDKELNRFVPLAKSGRQRPAVNAGENVDRFSPTRAKRVRLTIRATNKLEPCIDELEVFDPEGVNVALSSTGTIASCSGEILAAGRHELKHVHDGRYGNSSSWMGDRVAGSWVMLEFPEEQLIERVIWGRDRDAKFSDRLAIDYVLEAADASGKWCLLADADDRMAYGEPAKKTPNFSLQDLSDEEAQQAKPLLAEKASLVAKINAARTQAFAGKFREPDTIHLLSRGDPEQPREVVVPAVLSSFGDLQLALDAPDQLRRRVLADWIASPRNPLTARVMVNRLWQGHFGTGIVETPSDFGRSGMPPSHPELLDWLAAEFIRVGWSMKQMHRLMVLSATYRQSSFHPSPAADEDGESRLLWRFPSLRLSSESMHDSMLAVSGLLNSEMYGRGFDLFDKRGGLSGFQPVEKLEPANQRRMIYAHKVRRETEAVFGAFDCPDAGQSTARRRVSTTPIQALNLFNSRFTLEATAAFAERVKLEVGDDLQRQIVHAYQLALSREPSPEELDVCEPIVRAHGLALLCRTLFNTNEFLFLP